MRLISLSWKTLSTAVARSSAEAVISMACSPFHSMRRARALEVEAGGDLARGLAQGVVDLLTVQLAHDVEARVGHLCLLVGVSEGAPAIRGEVRALLLFRTARQVARAAKGS